MGVSNHAPVQPYRSSAHPRDGNGRPVYSLPAVLDHLLVDVISSIRRSFDHALLQRQAVEERFKSTSSSGTCPGRPPTACPASSSRPGSGPIVSSVDWAHLEPDLVPELEHRRAAGRTPGGWSLRWPCRYSAWPWLPTPRPCWPPCPRRTRCWAPNHWCARRPPSSRCTQRRQCAVGGRGHLRGLSALQRAPARRPRRDHAGDRRSDPMDRLHPHPSGRSALFISPARRGGLTEAAVIRTGVLTGIE